MDNFFSTNFAFLHNSIRVLRAPPFLATLAQPSGAPPSPPAAQDLMSAPWGCRSLPQWCWIQQSHSPAAHSPAELGVPQAQALVLIPTGLPSAWGWDSLGFPGASPAALLRYLLWDKGPDSQVAFAGIQPASFFSAAFSDAWIHLSWLKIFLSIIKESLHLSPCCWVAL